MKPRIFINMHYMELGGAERALLGLLEAVDYTRLRDLLPADITCSKQWLSGQLE